MYHITLSGIFTLLVISACFNGCTTPELEGDPRKLSIYQIEVKRTDVDIELENEDCAEIPENPCYCIDEVTGGDSYVYAQIKNCGEEGTAENISVATTIYPQSGNPFALSSNSGNPQSLQQDSVGIISFSTSTQFTNVDSVRFILNWKWAGDRTIQRDTIFSITACSRCE